MGGVYYIKVVFTLLNCVANEAVSTHFCFKIVLKELKESAILGMTKGRVTNRRVISESYDFGELC
jgi:hypothetical protein